MKKVILIVAIVFASVMNAQEKTNKVAPSMVDVENSSISWKGFKPTGEHFGAISISKGFLEINQNKLIGGAFVFDMNSIVDLDMPADNKYNAKLIGHLKSEDFFDVAKYPTAKFKITAVSKKDGKLSISGDLTIKDVTKNITFFASLSIANGISTLTSDVFTVNRADYNVRYGSKSFFNDLKDKFINDEFEISFKVVSKK